MDTNANTRDVKSHVSDYMGLVRQLVHHSRETVIPMCDGSVDLTGMDAVIDMYGYRSDYRIAPRIPRGEKEDGLISVLSMSSWITKFIDVCTLSQDLRFDVDDPNGQDILKLLDDPKWRHPLLAFGTAIFKLASHVLGTLFEQCSSDEPCRLEPHIARTSPIQDVMSQTIVRLVKIGVFPETPPGLPDAIILKRDALSLAFSSCASFGTCSEIIRAMDCWRGLGHEIGLLDAFRFFRGSSQCSAWFTAPAPSMLLEYLGFCRAVSCMIPSLPSESTEGIMGVCVMAKGLVSECWIFRTSDIRIFGNKIWDVISPLVCLPTECLIAPNYAAMPVLLHFDDVKACMIERADDCHDHAETLFESIGDITGCIVPHINRAAVSIEGLRESQRMRVGHLLAGSSSAVKERIGQRGQEVMRQFMGVGMYNPNGAANVLSFCTPWSDETFLKSMWEDLSLLQLLSTSLPLISREVEQMGDVVSPTNLTHWNGIGCWCDVICRDYPPSIVDLMAHFLRHIHCTQASVVECVAIVAVSASFDSENTMERFVGTCIDPNISEAIRHASPKFPHTQ
eukprot:GHVO01016672.1.p1 GENE.GHVO01016672.1~~GHVO01016672.1.p1  ORF type:complete len:612 (+),score=115.64 GHVO01016672.1:143-1837(+)